MRAPKAWAENFERFGACSSVKINQKLCKKGAKGHHFPTNRLTFTFPKVDLSSPPPTTPGADPVPSIMKKFDPPTATSTPSHAGGVWEAVRRGAARGGECGEWRPWPPPKTSYTRPDLAPARNLNGRAGWRGGGYQYEKPIWRSAFSRKTVLLRSE